LNKKQIHTIILQEEKIQQLTERCRQLQMGYDSIMEQNKRLREKIKKLEGLKSELSNVNV
jgi:FtsZ-binding cell division protein ZapB